MSSVIAVRAPSNIAWLKYMGKHSISQNLPENPSLSMTLNRLCTALVLKVEPTKPSQDGTEAFSLRACLSESSRQLFPAQLLQDLDRSSQADKVKLFSPEAKFKFERHYHLAISRCESLFAELELEWDGQISLAPVSIESTNTFPAAAGVASSASSFAALTLAAAVASAKDRELFVQLYRGALSNSEHSINHFPKSLEAKAQFLRRGLAVISREGSGSSCRSFDGPFVGWPTDGEQIGSVLHGFSHELQAGPLDGTQFQKLRHFVLLVSSEEKSVSSSQAHARVKSSPLWNGRIQRAEKRYETLKTALSQRDLSVLSQQAWQEFFEMHSLFHTANPAFSYWKPGSIQVLNYFMGFFNETKHQPDSRFGTPIVTMDAGANVHVTVQEQFAAIWRGIFEKELKFPVLEDELDLSRPRFGAEILSV